MKPIYRSEFRWFSHPPSPKFYLSPISEGKWCSEVLDTASNWTEEPRIQNTVHWNGTHLQHILYITLSSSIPHTKSTLILIGGVDLGDNIQQWVWKLYEATLLDINVISCKTYKCKIYRYMRERAFVPITNLIICNWI